MFYQLILTQNQKNFLETQKESKKIEKDIYIIDKIPTSDTEYEAAENLKQDEKNQKINLKEGDTLWVSAYTFHGFSGKGSLIKISDGQNINYLEKIELANTYNLKNTLSRGRDDMMTWGYDN